MSALRLHPCEVRTRPRIRQHQNALRRHCKASSVYGMFVRQLSSGAARPSAVGSPQVVRHQAAAVPACSAALRGGAATRREAAMHIGHESGSPLQTAGYGLPNLALESDTQRHGTLAARRRGLSCTSRPGRHAAACRSALR